MKIPSVFVACALFALGFLLPATLLAKGDGVGFWMEGVVTDVTVEGEKIQFLLKGQFRFDQYPDGQSPQIIKVDCKQGISATVHQAEPFFAFTADWKAGSIQDKGGLLRILKAAVERGNVVRFELSKPQIAFDGWQHITLADSAVVRATDVDLH